MADTYTVKKGDTLSEIAQKYKSQYGYPATVAGTYEYTNELVRLNNIKDPDYIVVGQVIKLSGSATPASTNKTSKATINVFGLQSNTDRTMYATWTWSKSNTENYQVIWYYDTGDKVWFIGSNTKVEDNQCTYTAPTNALRVKFKVKPISKTKTVNDKQTSYWTAGWSTEKTYDFSNNPPTTPAVPTVSIDKYKLTATLDNLDVNGTLIRFQVVKNNSTVFRTGTAKIVTGHASYSCTIDAGAEYKVRCRAERGSSYSDWTDYSANQSTVPAASNGITTLKALSDTSVQIDWDHVATATSYEVEYTTKKMYFDSSTEVKSMTVKDGWSHAEITGLTSGEEYFFRVRAVNDKGNSPWCEIKSIIIGKDPAAPTTWSSTTTAIVGEELTLYWVHNAEDGSTQTYAELELYINGVKETETIATSTAEGEEEKTYSYKINTTAFVEGSTIQWRVRTAGITKTYGDWSVQRTIDIYTPPTLELSVIDGKGNSIETLYSFPFYVSGLAGPNTQAPIGYHVTVTSNEGYETVDNIGNPKLVSVGDAIYSKHFDTNDPLMVEFSASNLNLENNVSYTITCTVSMNSGLTAESSVTIDVAWADLEYEPNAEISIDTEAYTASIMPYCQDVDGTLIENISLSVYRREFNGSFTELVTGLDNSLSTCITDPHPALDYARYRIVAITNDTGAVSYCDLPGIPVGGEAALIQWDEEWTSYNTVNEDAMEERSWTGSMLKLPYNIDISDDHKPDVVLVEYEGREHPTTYYGTQLGHTSNWSMDIKANDDETLYGLRRLASWMGDVYVREPSGSGYWANVTVSYSQTHCSTVIPVTLSVKRVSGGV